MSEYEYANMHGWYVRAELEWSRLVFVAEEVEW